ncbi:MAG: hypothetical protein ACI4LO_02520 [Anaerovoracaceae bacterium]
MNKNIKRIIALALSAVLIMTLFTGCKNSKDEEVSVEEKIDFQTNLFFNDLLVNLTDITDVQALRKHLCEWAEEKGIEYSYDKYNNVIMTKHAAEGFEEAPSAIVQCSMGTGDSLLQYQAMAAALYMIDKVQNQGDLRVIFTVADENGYTGAENIDAKYLDADYFINLTHAEKTSFTIGSAGTSHYAFSKELNWIAPTYPNAYELSIRGLNGGSSGITSGPHPNPIKIIGDFLASAKSKGVLMEIASFNGGQAADRYPSDATAVVLINHNDVSRFEKWSTQEIKEFEDKYSETEENYTFTITPVESPQTAISKDDSTNILGLMYTMINGTYLKTEEKEVIATSNIGVISTSTGNLNVEICARSLDSAVLEEMGSAFDVICGLNDISHTNTAQSPIWLSDEESPLLISLTEIFDKDFDKKVKYKTTMENTECAIFKNRNPELDILSMSVNLKNNVTELAAVQTFLENLTVQNAQESEE